MMLVELTAGSISYAWASFVAIAKLKSVSVRVANQLRLLTSAK